MGLNDLEPKWQKSATKRALGGRYAIGGFDYQFNFTLNEFFRCAPDFDIEVSFDLLSDVSIQKGGSVEVIQVKKTLDKSSYDKAVQEAEAIDKFLASADPAIHKAVKYRLITQKKKSFKPGPIPTALATKMVQPQESSDPESDLVSFLSGKVRNPLSFIGLCRSELERLIAGHAPSSEISRHLRLLFEQNSLSLPTNKKWNIPAPTSYFTGQDEVLEKLQAPGKTSLTQPTSLRGFGGIGKTQVALQYASLNEVKHGAGFFAVATSPSALDLELAKFLHGDLPADVSDEVVERLKNEAITHLKGAKDALVILDNVDDWVQTDEFAKFVNALGAVKLIVTCRHNNVGEQFEVVPVEKMDDKTGAKFMLDYAGRNEPYGDEFEDAKTLSNELGGLPLALHHAGAIFREGKSANEVLHEYRQNRERLLKNRDQSAGATHPDSAYVMIISAFEKLSLAAQELVTCCAFLPPDRIREFWFADGFFQFEEPLQERMTEFAAVRTDALRSTLLEREVATQTLSIHRVTQAVIQEWIRAQGLEKIEHRLVSVSNRCVCSHLRKGFYRDGIEVAEFSLSQFRQHLGEAHPFTLTSMSNLAESYRSMGRHEEALDLHEQTLKLSTASLGETHPDTQMSMNNLAITYGSMGRHQEALELEEQTLRLSTASLGETHPNTLTCMNNLAIMYGSMGRHQEALALHEQTLMLRKASLVETHPDTLTSMSNLAELYWSKGRHQEALELQEHTLKLRKDSLGETHPDTLTSMNNLATIFYSMRRLDDAICLMTEVVQGLETVLGEGHPNTQLAKENLAIMLAERDGSA